MKIKDLMGLNPDAEIIVVDKFGHQFKDELSYGWDAENDCEPGTDTKSIAKEVCIFLGNTSELTQCEA